MLQNSVAEVQEAKQRQGEAYMDEQGAPNKTQT